MNPDSPLSTTNHSKRNRLSLGEVADMMRRKDAGRIYAKPLAPTDSSQGQIYLRSGKGPEVFNVLPHDPIYLDTSPPKNPNFKAPLNFHWMDDEGNTFRAPGAQLILYPEYPEVRLSGLINKAEWAPREVIRDRSERRGRLLIAGIRSSGAILAYAMPAEDRSPDDSKLFTDEIGVFHQLAYSGIPPRARLIETLREIHQEGWVRGCRLKSDGSVEPYDAQNGPGYTLEALLDIRPNSNCEPDFEGWEIKTHSKRSSTPITLFTPEPDGGLYGEDGLEKFIRQHGYESKKKGRLNFSSRHRAGKHNQKTGLKLVGYDYRGQRLEDLHGGLRLIDEDGNPKAKWSFAKLIDMWNRKHARAAYVRYERRERNGHTEYRFGPKVRIGIGTDFHLFLDALARDEAFFDPGSKLTGLHTGNTKVKARSQWRIPARYLNGLYDEMTKVTL
jgi:hypothetical protein